MAMNTQSTNRHHYSPPIGQEVLQAPVSTDSGTEYSSHDLHQFLYDLSPESPETTNPSTDFSAGLLPVRSAQTRPEGQGVEFLKLFYPLFVCASALGG